MKIPRVRVMRVMKRTVTRLKVKPQSNLIKKLSK